MKKNIKFFNKTLRIENHNIGADEKTNEVYMSPRFGHFITSFVVLFGFASIVWIFVITLQKPVANYNELCGVGGRTCLSKLGLECINEQCQCNSNSYFAKECRLKRTYLDKCHNISTLCNDELNLKCINGFCNCDNFNYWNGEACKIKQSYNELCQNTDVQCQTSLNLFCDSTQMKCHCHADK